MSSSLLAGPRQKARASVLYLDDLEGAGMVQLLHLIPVASWAASRRSVLQFLGTPKLQSLKTWGCNTVKAMRRLGGSLLG